MNVVEESLTASWRDYLELGKPRVVLMMLLCALVGMFLATPAGESLPLDLVAVTMLGIALMAGSAAGVNHIADARIDAIMARTMNRPIVTGRVPTHRALALVAVTGIVGFALLFVFINPLTAWLNLFSWVGYGLIYTLYLKRATPQNIVIGGIFGAAPPLFGWTAVTGELNPNALLLVLIIFVWTPPHFWALALDRKAEYANAMIPMLPVTHGEAYTRLQILLYTLLLLVSSVLPFIVGMNGILYLAGALALGAGFLYWAIALYFQLKSNAAIETFRYSILYIMALFVFLMLDHALLGGTSAAIQPSLLEWQRID